MQASKPGCCVQALAGLPDTGSQAQDSYRVGCFVFDNVIL